MQREVGEHDRPAERSYLLACSRSALYRASFIFMTGLEMQPDPLKLCK